MRPGVVYIIINDQWPGLVKVGYSARSGHARAWEFQRDAGTGVPGMYRCVYQRRFDDCVLAEGLVHGALRGRRAHKEWFRCDIEQARLAIDECPACDAGSGPGAKVDANPHRPQPLEQPRRHRSHARHSVLLDLFALAVLAASVFGFSATW
jgi:hypothetical protein